MKTISVIPNFRLIIRDALNIVVEQVRQSQPNPFKRDEPFVAKTLWTEIGSYGRTFTGLGAALKRIIVEAAIDGLAPDSELAEFAKSLKTTAENIDQALCPKITVKLDDLPSSG